MLSGQDVILSNVARRRALVGSPNLYRLTAWSAENVADPESVTVDEMAEVIKHQDVKAWLASIDLDISEDFDAVVQVLDPEGTGLIQQKEFYRLVGRFRGPARRLETSLCLLEARHAARESHELLRRLHLTIGNGSEALKERRAERLTVTVDRT